MTYTKVTGVYKIQSRIRPSKIYIGSSNDIHERWYQHLRDLKLGTHKNPKLQTHYNKYGKEDLVFFILLSCEDESVLETEQYFMDVYNPWFNVHKLAGHTRGWVPTQKTRDLWSKQRKGRIPWNKGIKMGKFSEERLKQHSELHKGQVPWIKGKHHSDESKKKSSDSHKKYVFTKKHKENLLLAWVKRRGNKL